MADRQGEELIREAAREVQVAICNSIRSGCGEAAILDLIPAPAPGLHYRQCWLAGLKRGHGSLRLGWSALHEQEQEQKRE